MKPAINGRREAIAIPVKQVKPWTVMNRALRVVGHVATQVGIERSPQSGYLKVLLRLERAAVDTVKPSSCNAVGG